MINEPILDFSPILYLKRHTYNMGTPTSMASPASFCKAIIQEGARKGNSCVFPPSENGYCGRHQRHKIYDDGIFEGKRWCRFFFRGCDNPVDNTTVTCSSCKSKKTEDKPTCNHEGCRYLAKDGKYCGKHKRDTLKDKEAEEGIRYCDIARGCLNICPEGFSRCESCRLKDREKENSVYNSRKQIHSQKTPAAPTTSNPCCYCGKEFEPFLTKLNKYSRACAHCNAIQKEQDNKRKDRKRNYKSTNLLYPDTHYKQYLTNAVNRSLPFELKLEEFTDLVSKPCYYCGYTKEGEVIGIDRFNNDIGYTLKNSRPCCEECNIMKYSFHPLFFIEKSKLLASCLPDSEKFFDKWACYYSRVSSPFYSSYKYGAKKRKLAFEITQEEFKWLISKPCYLCGYKGPNGIDRKDSKKGYAIDNCYACCYSCNVMKLDIEYSKMIEKTCMISSIWGDTSSICLPFPSSKESKKLETIPRKHWKASGVYTALISNSYEPLIESLSDVATREEVEELRLIIFNHPHDDAISSIKTFLNKCNIRRKRKKKADESTLLDDIETADTIQLVE